MVALISFIFVLSQLLAAEQFTRCAGWPDAAAYSTGEWAAQV